MKTTIRSDIQLKMIDNPTLISDAITLLELAQTNLEWDFNNLHGAKVTSDASAEISVHIQNLRNSIKQLKTIK